MTDQSYLGSADPQTASGQYSQLEFIARMVMGRLATAQIVLVNAVDPTARTVDVQPCVAQIDGYGNAVPHGTIHSVPFAQYIAGPNLVRMSPVKGDIGICVFASSDISSVKANKAPANPGSRRRFDWSDGMYILGLWSPVAPTRYIDFDAENVTIQPAGVLDVLGDLHATGTITGDTDVVAAGISGKGHTHDGVTAGRDDTGPPNS